MERLLDQLALHSGGSSLIHPLKLNLCASLRLRRTATLTYSCIVVVQYHVAVLQFRSGSPSAFAAILPQLRLADVASRIEPDSPDHDKRTFECPTCENVVSEIVKYRRN